MTEQIFCTACGAANVADARFCHRCGQAITAGVVPPAARPPSDFITLSCPNCGGRLQITQDMERFACQFCGMEHLVRRSGSAVSLAPVLEGLKRVEGKFDQVQVSSDRLAAEQTLQRLRAEVVKIEKQAAEKDLFLRMNGTAVNALIGPIVLMTIGVLTPVVGLIISFITDEPVLILVTLFIGGFLLFGGVIGLIIELNSKKRRQVTQAKDALARLQAELQNHHQQIERLHRFTADR